MPYDIYPFTQFNLYISFKDISYDKRYDDDIFL